MIPHSCLQYLIKHRTRRWCSPWNQNQAMFLNFTTIVCSALSFSLQRSVQITAVTRLLIQCPEFVMKSRCSQLSAGSRARTAASASDPTPAPVPMAGWAVSAKSVCMPSLTVTLTVLLVRQMNLLQWTRRRIRDKTIKIINIFCLTNVMEQKDIYLAFLRKITLPLHLQSKISTF